MANVLLTPVKITREALRILHQKLTFVGAVNKQYDDQFAVSGAKIGDELTIRLPNEYKVYDGADQTGNFQDTKEQSVKMKIDTQKSVPLAFTDRELTLNIDDFSERYLEPAMTVLAANIENDCIKRAYAEVYNQVGVPGTIPNNLKVLNQARQMLTDSLAPGSQRTMILNTDAQVEVVDAVKGLFNDGNKISKQYRDGILASTAGFGDIYESTIVPVHTNGTQTGSLTVTAAPTEGSNLINLTGTGTQVLKRGTIFTIPGVFKIHPETKEIMTGKLQQFVVLADATAVGGAYTGVQVAPSFIASTSNARQNINALPAISASLSVAGSASTSYAQNLAFHKDAFSFATADLFVPKGAHFAGREVMDGISMRIWKDADIKTGALLTRCDVLYGFQIIRRQLATRITA